MSGLEGDVAGIEVCNKTSALPVKITRHFLYVELGQFVEDSPAMMLFKDCRLRKQRDVTMIASR